MGSLRTPITKVLSNLTLELFWPELDNPIASLSNIGPPALNFKKVDDWPVASDAKYSTGDYIGWGFFGLFTCWLWGPALLFVLYCIALGPTAAFRWLYRKATGKDLGSQTRRHRDRRSNKQRAREERIALRARRGDQRRRWAVEELAVPRAEKAARNLRSIEDLESGGAPLFCSLFLFEWRSTQRTVRFQIRG